MYSYMFHIRDFRNATHYLDFVEKSIFRGLLDIYYDTEERLPDDLELLAEFLRLENDEQKQALQKVLQRFFCLSKASAGKPSRWYIKRVDQEIKNYKQKKGYYKQTTNTSTNKLQTDLQTQVQTNDKHPTDAQKEHQERMRAEYAFMITALKNKGFSVNTRTPKPQIRQLFDEHCKQDFDAKTAVQTQLKTNDKQSTNNDKQRKTDAITNNHKPITNNQLKPKAYVADGDTIAQEHTANPKDTQQPTPKAKAGGKGGNNTDFADRFAQFYEMYPVKKSKGKAENALAKLLKNAKDADALFLEIMQGLKNQLPQLNQSKSDGFCKHPSSWLNSECWLDEITTPAPQAKPQAGFSQQRFDKTSMKANFNAKLAQLKQETLENERLANERFFRGDSDDFNGGGTNTQDNLKNATGAIVDGFATVKNETEDTAQDLTPNTQLYA